MSLLSPRVAVALPQLRRWTRGALSMAAAFALAGCGGADQDTEQELTEDTLADTEMRVVVAEVGLATPESVLHDPDADAYLVSNINGSPTEKDANGFISRITPDGTVETLKWIDGSNPETPLNAPKGMALMGDTLFVSDIDSVRAFHRGSGEYLGARGIPGVTFLNDLAAGSDGMLYVTDSGMNPDFSSSGTDAIYRFTADGPETVALGPELSGPNGLVMTQDGLVFVTFSGADVRLAQPVEGQAASVTTIATLPGGQLDGVVQLGDGSFLVSSWETQSIYHVPARGQGGSAMVAVEGVPSPADIGWDPDRRWILIPVFQENRVIFEPLPPMG